MALKNFRPLTPTQRFKQTPGFEEITKDKPEKSLLEPRKRSGGRNNTGRLTSRHIGGGHKQKYRVIDFKRKLRDVAATVEAIEYDPNRSARIALLQYPGGEKTYILAPAGLKVGAKVIAGDKVAPDLGNALPLKSIPLGTAVHNVEIIPGRGGQVARSAGQQAILSNREAGYALVRMPSGEIRRIHENAYATIGQVGNVGAYECLERQSGAQSLAGPAVACSRYGDEPDRPPDGWRPGKEQGWRWSTSSGEPLGSVVQRI